MNSILDILAADSHHEPIVLDVLDEDTQAESTLRKGQRANNLSIVFDILNAFESIFVEKVESLVVVQTPLIRVKLEDFDSDLIVKGFIDDHNILLEFIDIVLFEIVGDFYNFVFDLLVKD